MAWRPEEEARLRQVIKDSGVALLKENLVQGTWGNTAVRLDEDHMLVTPTGLVHKRFDSFYIFIY